MIDDHPSGPEPVSVVGSARAPDRARTRRLGWWIAAIVLLVVLVSLVPAGAGYLASRLLANASPPTGVEFPSTPVGLLAAADETTALAGQGRGLNCSIPWAVEQVAFGFDRGRLSPSARYRQACVAHDLCYRHGAATYGYTQADCDQMLMRSAFRMCKKSEDDRRRRDASAFSAVPATTTAEDATYDRCVNEARMVFFGVFMGGATAYRPIEPEAAGRVAYTEGSGPAEYDPYPAGGASYSVARLVRGSGTTLLLFRRSSGGAKYVRRDWNGLGFSDAVSAPLPSRWEDLPAPPFVSRGPPGRPDVLVWWLRSVGMRYPTNGRFEIAPVSAFAGPADFRRVAASGNFDPGSSQFFAVPGRSPDGKLHLVGVTEFPGRWHRCGESTAGIQIVHVSLDLYRIGKRPFFRCVLHHVGRATGVVGQAEQVGSYLGEAPALTYDGNAIRVTIFRRDGERDQSDYRDVLSGTTMRIPLDDRGDRRPMPIRRCWRISESEEPFFAPAGTEERLSTLTFSDRDRPVDPDRHPDAPLLLRSLLPGPSGSDCGKADPAWRLPTEARSYLRARVIHVRTDRNSDLRLSASTDSLVLTRVMEVDRRLQGSALVVSMNAGLVVGCTQSFFDLPDSSVTEPGEALQREAGFEPIIGDLNEDGVPDLVLADTRGGMSFGFLGLDGGRGRLAFMPVGSRTARVGRVRCDRVR